MLAIPALHGLRKIHKVEGLLDAPGGGRFLQ